VISPPFEQFDLREHRIVVRRIHVANGMPVNLRVQGLEMPRDENPIYGRRICRVVAFAKRVKRRPNLIRMYPAIRIVEGAIC